MWCDTFLLCRACFWLHFTFIVTDNGCKQELFRNNQVSFANDYDRLQNILNRNRNNSVISFMNIPKKFLLASMLLVCSAWTKAETVPGLTLISSTGEKFSFALTERPRIVQELEQYTKYYLVVYSNGKQRLKYRMMWDTVEKVLEDVDIVTKIKSPEVSGSKDNHVVFKINDDGFVAGGLKTGETIKVFLPMGELVRSIKADSNGVAEVSLSDCPRGVYVVSTSQGISYKFVNNVQ